jgi:hypothetical protein
MLGTRAPSSPASEFLSEMSRAKQYNYAAGRVYRVRDKRCRDITFSILAVGPLKRISCAPVLPTAEMLDHPPRCSCSAEELV